MDGNVFTNEWTSLAALVDLFQPHLENGLVKEGLLKNSGEICVT
jgi:hypothetical protein